MWVQDRSWRLFGGEIIGEHTLYSASVSRARVTLGLEDHSGQ